MGPILQIVRNLKKISIPLQIIVVTGTNFQLKKKLLFFKSSLFHIFEFTHQISELMDSADLILTKPGGVTLSEALSKEKPILVFQPLPGQEKRNVQYLLDKNAIEIVQNLNEISQCVENLFTKPKQRQKLIANALKISTPYAAIHMAHKIIFFLNKTKNKTHTIYA